MRNKKPLLIFIFFIFLCSLSSCCILAYIGEKYSSMINSGIQETVIKKGDPEETVAVIRVDGVISQQTSSDFFGNESPDMTSETISQIKKAEHDDNVKALLLEIDSPGGEAYASKLIYNALVNFKETGKPIVVLMKNQAASGAYYISLPADIIVASNSTTTGSIGVVVTGTDLTALYEKVGIKEFNVINSQGNMKILENLTSKDSDSYKILQSVLDDVYDEFAQAVATNRDMSVDEVRKIADGRIYSGKQAKDLNLIDTIGEQEVAEDNIERLAALNRPHYVLYKSTVDNLSIYSLSLTKILFPELSLLEGRSSGIQINFIMPL